MNILYSAWPTIIIRIAIGLIAGEIAIRYTSWWLTLYDSGQKFAASSVVLGVAICSTAICCLELQLMLIRTLPSNVEHIDLTQGHSLVMFFRIVLLTGAAFLSYPVNVIVYRHSWRRVLTEILVRFFLIITAFIAGMQCSTLYHCQMTGVC